MRTLLRKTRAIPSPLWTAPTPVRCCGGLASSAASGLSTTPRSITAHVLHSQRRRQAALDGPRRWCGWWHSTFDASKTFVNHHTHTSTSWSISSHMPHSLTSPSFFPSCHSSLHPRHGRNKKPKYKIRGACLLCVVDPWYLLPHLFPHSLTFPHPLTHPSLLPHFCPSCQSSLQP